MIKHPLLEIDNVWTKIIYPANDIYERLDKLEATLNKTGAGIYNKNFTSFFSGLSSYILNETGGGYIDKRPRPMAPVERTYDRYADRPYQGDAIERAIKYHRGLMKLPTGAGKSRIAIGLMESIRCTWLFLVHKANLVDDIANAFEQLTGERCGRIHGNANSWEGYRVVCATQDSIDARKNLNKLVTSVEGVLVDECHKIPTETCLNILIQTTNAFYRFGLSATPLLREDRRDLHTIALLGPQFFEIDFKTLAKLGYIVEPIIRWIDCKLPFTASKYWNDYNFLYDQLITYNQNRNGAIKDIIKNGAELPVIIFVTKHAHQDYLKSLIPYAVTVNERTSIDERQKIVNGIKNGSVPVVISSQVFSEGMDAPSLRTVVNATACASWTQAIQDIGRGTRPSPGKDFFTVYDFNDIGQEWFEEHTAQRYMAYKSLGVDVNPPSRHANRVFKAEQDRINMFEMLKYKE